MTSHLQSPLYPALYPDVAAAVAREHQADLLREAAQRRLARTAHRGSPAAQTSHRWWRRLLLPLTTPLPVAGSPSHPA